MHGYEPGTVTPTTDLVLSHQHADDRAEVAGLCERIGRNREAFSTSHRIVDAEGHVRYVVVVGNQLRNDTGDVIGSDGFYVDLTPSVQTLQQYVSDDVEDITARRSAIDQAKGMLMAVYRIHEDAAFDLLRWRSQHTNVKIRDLAHQIVADFSTIPAEGPMPSRSVYDSLLMTAHLRAQPAPDDEAKARRSPT